MCTRDVQVKATLAVLSLAASGCDHGVDLLPVEIVRGAGRLGLF